MAAIEAFGLTDVGKKRKHNEDAYTLDEAEGLFIVADGMGGHAAGEVAAKITVETIGEFIAATRQKEEATWPFKYNHELDFNSNRLAIAIEKANERVMSAVAAQPWLKGMGTTGGALERKSPLARSRRRQPRVPLPVRRADAPDR
jgi:protein phosphatase